MKALLLTTLLVTSLSKMGKMRSANTDLGADGKCTSGPGLKVKMAQIDSLLAQDNKSGQVKTGASTNK